MRKLLITAMMGLTLGFTTSAKAAGDAVELIKQDWSFQGMFGTFNREHVKKGGAIFFNVCAGCHSASMLSYRNLTDIGWTEEEAKEIASYYEVQDGPNDEGEMFMRPATLSDRFVAPFANEKMARAMNGGAYPPDLSVITKARKGGPDYLYSLLVGYEEAPEDFEMPAGTTYNKFFPGHKLFMPQPLWGEDVEFADGTTASIEEESKYITTFLAWAAEPELEARKSLGIKVLLYLIIMTGLLYALKHRIWARICLDEYTHGPYVEEYQKSIDDHKLPS